jgi:membrane protein
MAVYAGFAVVLMFLLWLYISWLVLMLGAQLSFYVQEPEHLRSGALRDPGHGALREAARALHHDADRPALRRR